MADPGQGRDWWMWWCRNNPENCGGIDYCVRCTNLPSNCTVCGEPIPAANKQQMTAEEIEEHECECGQ